eukprot:CAMPEP_0175920716 /NCGR_PEP_ID=MMETSP0108-20121206/13075_1 /TAXON_ID=195067 ORGANISM="Goniomonas pacifica, Strain CCMP1869" /NCGR_SAMPLE_ID=MMETSP0108 /ASSEMBLY_ACC=CAM_ASM_000204 /LENGTH=143 /DNA_ID=CAMNT_0017243447 /DNA_START=183 /DNA_END=614 /DNA_ORIENTATION=+
MELSSSSVLLGSSFRLPVCCGRLSRSSVTAELLLGVFMLMEASNPFIHIRWFLFTLDKHKTLWYTANGVILLFAWFATRFVSVSWILHFYAAEKGETFLTLHRVLQPQCIGSIVVLYAFNAYFFAQMLAKARLHFGGGRTHKD